MWLKPTAILLCCFIVKEINTLQLIDEDLTLTLDISEAETSISLALNGEEKLSGQIGEGISNLVAPDFCEGTNHCILQGDEANLTIAGFGGGFVLSWVVNDDSLNELLDCYDVNIDGESETHWYGGAENYYHPEWPIENVQFDKKIYTVNHDDYAAVSERYWLNSKGGFIFIADTVPLYLDQNNRKSGEFCYLASINNEPYLGREKITFEYVIVAKNDPREAHLFAVNSFLGKPTGHPDERIIRKPIWTTWAKYHKDISDEVLLDFAQGIADNGYTGQLEIDDYWETCYGSLTFNENFTNINSTVQSLKDLGFTVTLWTHPFVNTDCTEPSNYGQEHDFFVKSRNGSDLTDWWDGDQARHIDFTKEEARNWFTDRLKLLQDKHGIDSFKFDAGENDWAPRNLVVSGDIQQAPNSLTSDYIRTCGSFGGLIEVRAGWRTQDLPIFVRIMDRDSRWGMNNGLQSLITTLLILNINGYTMVLPDIIGGDAYDDGPPQPELLVRWTQATAFMPAMQFSTLPWDIPSDQFDAVTIVKNFVDLHEEYADEILKAMDDSIVYGTPVNPPIWWADPTNLDALGNSDEFMLGENILVAPILEEGARSRNIILPAGTWKDGNSDEIYEGPLIINDYPAPIEVLPYFLKQ